MRHLLIFLFLLITYIPQISAQTNAEIKALQKEQQNLKK
jgi:hypothetical protein